MKFTRICLRNIRCYESVDLSLRSGVTVIHGPNGSGKTTLLEACFFALYGARALDETLDSFMMSGAPDAEVQLWFTHDGVEYHLKRQLRRTSDRASTAECILETPDESVTGARDVETTIAELLRMDADAFVNCAYVRQGEINKLIHASPSTRQDIIDDLLQLGVLEEYRDRAGDARLAVQDKRNQLEAQEQQLADRIETKEQADLHAQLNEIESDLNNVDSELDRIESQLETAKQTRDDAVDILTEYEENRSRIDELAADIQSLEETISATENKRSELRDEIGKLKDRREQFVDRRQSLLANTDLTDAEEETISEAIEAAEQTDDSLRDELESIRIEINSLESTISTLDSDIEDLQDEIDQYEREAESLREEIATEQSKVDSKRDELTQLQTDIDRLKDQLSGASIDVSEISNRRDELDERREVLTERRTDLIAERETISSHIDRGEELLAAGKCPECGQPVDDAPHVESLDEYTAKKAELTAQIEEIEAELESVDDERERLDEIEEIATKLAQKKDQLSSIEELLAQREATIDDKRTRLEKFQEQIATNRETIDQLREKRQSQEEILVAKRERIGELNRQRTEVSETIDRLETLQELNEQIESIDDTVEQHRQRRKLLDEQNTERRETLAEKRQTKRELEAEYNEDRIAEAREEKARAEKYIEQATEEIEELESRQQELQQRRGSILTDIDELESLRDEHKQLTNKLEAVASLHEEVSSLEELYGDLRASLRQRNVNTLESLLNETFDLIYRNDAYDRIELSGDYELTVYQKDGDALAPEQLSGGERALFNLSLRCAIYRLLAEGIEGTAPMPPLILDEPTVFLDSGHVEQLVTLVETMHELGVEQIIVVSHDDHLLDAANDRISVSKNPATNQSTVSRESLTIPGQAD